MDTQATTAHVPGFDFASGCLRYNDAKPGVTPTPLWFGIFPGRVTLINGEAGAGKSSLLRLIALHAALNLPLFDIEFGLGRRANVLYIDPENMGDAAKGDGGITTARLDKLGEERPRNLLLHDGTVNGQHHLDLSDARHLKGVEAFIKANEVDLLILDPYIALANVQNENDNAEANKIAKGIKRLATVTGCAIVLVHHTGKISEEGSSHQKTGRGASALGGAVDLSISFRLKNSRTEDSNDDEGEIMTGTRTDFVKASIVKNRVGFSHGDLFLRMAGEGRFDRVSSKAYNRAGQGLTREAKKEQQENDARAAILQYLQDGNEHGWDILRATAEAKGVSKQNADKVIQMLEVEGTITKKVGQRNKKLYHLNGGKTSNGTSVSSPDAPLIVRTGPREKGLL